MIRRVLAVLVLVLSLYGISQFAVTAPTVLAADPLNPICATQPNSTVCSGRGNNDPLSGPNGVILKIARVVAILGGVLAIVVIIISGIRYVAANGDAQQAAGARRALLGAIIGLAIIALASVIATLILRSIYA